MELNRDIIVEVRGVAQLGRARGSGLRGRRFKSCRPDYETSAGAVGVFILLGKQLKLLYMDTVDSKGKQYE